MCNVHIEYSAYIFSGESKEGGGAEESPKGKENSVVLRGLTKFALTNQFLFGIHSSVTNLDTIFLE